ncbi:hypothetical protein [Serinicoccus sp. CUA-874]|uniref:hypothetical protein n=1 Tax=Serinicoccus sp. CUA-874 TaxID=1517939 RepID=UPI00117A8527|nr:hypothetical protein [Serinicoccus sp. CUA-874]
MSPRPQPQDPRGDATPRATPRADTPSGATPAALAPWVAAVVTFGSSAAVLVLEITALRLIAPYVGVTLETNTAVIGLALAAIAFAPGPAGPPPTAPRRAVSSARCSSSAAR